MLQQGIWYIFKQRPLESCVRYLYTNVPSVSQTMSAALVRRLTVSEVSLCIPGNFLIDRLEMIDRLHSLMESFTTFNVCMLLIIENLHTSYSVVNEAILPLWLMAHITEDRKIHNLE